MIRSPHRSLLPWTGAAVGLLAALAEGCGGNSEVYMGSTPRAGSAGAMAQGATGGTAGRGSFGSGGAAGSGVGGSSIGGTGGDVETCGGVPCSNHTGVVDFVDTDAPPDAPDTFGGGTTHDNGSDSAREPAMVYPSHETKFPINVSRIRHEWSAGGSNGLFKLSFVGKNTTVNVYTVRQDWQPTDEQWDWIAESNRGEAVTLTVYALDPSAPSDIWQAAPITLYFSDAEVDGAIYYWSTGTKGVMKALVSDPIPTKFYTDPTAPDAERCVACHTLSRDGKRLAVGYEGETLREVTVPERSIILPVGATATAGGMPPAMDKGGKGGMGGMGGMPAMPPPMEGMPSAWTTFSPDGEMLLVAADGILTLIDSDTGETIGPDSGVVPIPDGTVATHPDWSALGDRVVFTLGTKGGNKEVESGAIAILPYDAGTWGAPEVVVASTGTNDNNFFPVWSPDSKWIAYVNAVGNSKDAATATLRLIDPAVGTPIDMVRLNQRVNNQDGVLDVGNSMPTWAPSTKPGAFWLAFSSVRAYASVRPQDAKEDQIWIAAVDPSLADPGYAGFWAPFQSVDEGNHRAFWTHSSEDTQCHCVESCGDSIDNDCDGTADEEDCSVCEAVEICDDGIDNDCDCMVDDCGGEICGDGIDNDGDGAVDDADSACGVK
jgi:hypothetical protein